MSDAQGYEGMLVSYEDAVRLLWGNQVVVLNYAQGIYRGTISRYLKAQADAQQATREGAERAEGYVWPFCSSCLMFIGVFFPEYAGKADTLDDLVAAS